MMLRTKFSELRKYARIGRERMGGLLRSNKRIGYIGGQGNLNLGDDAMYLAANYLMKNEDIYSYEHPQREKRLSKIGLSDSKYFSSVVLGGGTLITPPNCGNWMEKAIFALSRDLPVCSFGTGVGGCGFAQQDSDLSEDLAQVLSKFKRIGVRGPRSLQKLNALGLDNIEVVGDLALGLTRDDLVPLSNVPSVAVNLAMPYGDSFDKYPIFEEIAKFLSMLHMKGWKIIPISTEWSDKYPLAELAKRLGISNWNLELINSTSAFLDMVAPCQFSISVRLHAAVLSCCVGVPSLKLAYRDKCWDFMEAMGLADWCVPLEGDNTSMFYERAGWFVDAAQNHRKDVLEKSIMWKHRLESFALKMIDSQ